MASYPERSSSRPSFRTACSAGSSLVAPHASGLYLSFETDQRPGRLEDAFPPATLARLRALKAEVDPENLFRDNFNVVAAQ